MARGRQPAGAFGARAAASRSSGHAAAAGKHKGRSRFARPGRAQRPAAMQSPARATVRAGDRTGAKSAS